MLYALQTPQSVTRSMQRNVLPEVPKDDFKAPVLPVRQKQQAITDHYVNTKKKGVDSAMKERCNQRLKNLSAERAVINQQYKMTGAKQ